MANREVIEKWVTALESGDYEQGTGFLTTVDEKGAKHCCLGVLCTLAVAEGIIPAPSSYTVIKHYGDDKNRSDLVLPITVQEWAGLEETDPFFKRAGLSDQTASFLNDSEDLSFVEIAAVIRDNFLEAE